jgi:NDP-sugar pyrophosphorylase family protein
VAFSREDQLLDTGGGLKRAAWFFDDGRPFLLHNVDVLSDIDLGGLMREHERSGALATLAAMRRATARPLLFDAAGLLCGRVADGVNHLVRSPLGQAEPMGFCGIHAASPALPGMLSETGGFSIVDSYLRLAAEGAPVRVFCADGARWRDAGRPHDLVPL